jgi:adenylate cyclase
MGWGAFRYLRKPRSFRVQILALFLSLFTIAFACVMGFTYSKDYRNILSLSKTVADEAMKAILIQFQAIAFGAERVTRTCAGFFPTIGSLDFQNPILKTYLLSVLRNDPHFANIYVGLPDGSTIMAMKTALEDRHDFLTDPQRPLPAEVTLALAFADMSTHPPVAHWYYLDNHFNELASETVASAPFDARARPWYQGAERSGKLFWTGLYIYNPLLHGEILPADPLKGLTVSHPLLNAQGQFEGVIGADLSVQLLAAFLSSQQVGRDGRAFIFNREGALVVPNLDPSASVTSHLAHVAFKQFLTHPDTFDFIIEQDGIKYLAFIAPLSYIFGADWLTVVVTPLNNFLGHVIQTQQEVLLFVILIAILSCIVVIYFSKRISSPIGILSQEIARVSQFHLEEHQSISSSVREIVALDRSIATMKRVVQSFARYVPIEVVKDLLKTNESVSLGGKKAEITIFFSDIANFTTIAESHPIDELLPLLEEYFEAMSGIILKGGGTIDKFIGDGIMAFWGAPLPNPHHPQSACDAALLCLAMLKGLNAKRRNEGKPEFFTRFGIHSGTVIVGNIGTEERMNYTIIGDAVNTTARLQEVDKLYHTSILISEEVYHRLGPEYIGRPVDVVAIKGKTKRTKIYELLGKKGAAHQIEPSEEQVALCVLFTAAYELLSQGRIQEARERFIEIARQFPQDFPTQMYLDRMK